MVVGLSVGDEHPGPPSNGPMNQHLKWTSELQGFLEGWRHHGMRPEYISERAEDEGSVNAEDGLPLTAILARNLTNDIDEGMIRFFTLFLGERMEFGAGDFSLLFFSSFCIILPKFL